MKIVDNEKKEVKQEKVIDKEIKKDNFWQIKDLPSKFKLYPVDTIIKGRLLKVLDIKLLSTIDEDNFNDIINDVLKRNIIGIDINELTVPDKMYIIFWLRANSYKESGYEINFDCIKCKKPATYNFSLDCLNVLYIKDGFNVNKTITLPMCGDKLSFTYLRIKDELNVEKFINKYETNIVKYNKDILNIATVMTTVNGEEKVLQEKYDYLVDLKEPADYGYIEAYLKHIDIGISPILNVTCNNCGGSALSRVTFRGDFFTPSYNFG